MARSEHSIAIPKGQSWFIKRMKKLHYESDANGVCFGILCMAIQAIHSGALEDELENFITRLKIIANMSENNFDVEIEKIRNDYINLTRQARIDFLQSQGQSEESISKMDKIEQKQWQAKINTAIQEKLNQLELDGKINRLRLEIPAFFDGVELYQQGYRYPHLFPKEKMQTDSKNDNIEEKQSMPAPTNQNALRMLPLVQSEKLEQLQKNNNPIEIVPGGSFSGTYSLNELTDYFSSLATVVNENLYNRPISLILWSANHSINVTYDSKIKKWILIDANELPIQRFEKAEDIALAVLRSLTFERGHITSFSTNIVAPKTQHLALQEILGISGTKQTWKSIPAINPTNVALSDPIGGFWLYIAARGGQNSLLKTLLKTDKSGIEKKYLDFNPLYAAANYGHPAAVKVLLDEGAKIDSICEGLTALHIAAKKGHADVIRILLNAGADKNLICNNATPLLLAAKEGHVRAVQVLIQAGASDQALHGDIETTPLYAAAEGGHIEVFNYLLQARTQKDKNFTTMTPLFIVAAQNGHVDIINALLTAEIKNNKGEKIYINPFPLFSAASKGYLADITEKHRYVKIVQALLKAGAIPDEHCKELVKQHGNQSHIIALLDLALTYTKTIDFNNPNLPFREQALKKLYYNCLDADDMKQMLHIQEQFKQFDQYAQEVSNIRLKYKTDNTKRNQSLTALETVINNAYQSYAEGKKEIHELTRDLVHQVDAIRKTTKTDHEQSSLLGSWSSSKLVIHIQEIPTPKYEIKNAANDLSYDAQSPRPDEEIDKSSPSASGWLLFNAWCNTDSAIKEPTSISPEEKKSTQSTRLKKSIKPTK